MALKTQGVYNLCRDVIESLATPYGPKVIEDVCLAIEADPIWMERYRQLVDSLGRNVTNNWIGAHVKAIVGMNTICQVPATRSKIIGSYTELKP